MTCSVDLFVNIFFFLFFLSMRKSDVYFRSFINVNTLNRKRDLSTFRHDLIFIGCATIGQPRFKSGLYCICICQLLP